ncbi:type IV secretion system DNA-binding domain-containing protein [Allokutzneria sp. A3M-2-11 16]|uniref:type IV secretory system conjugative DNA transfer family protein n=1 Tax=Allokutzneria sp. A3M-2-11 16 TaxID=2962043 RepID=UPI0020B7D598|nr:DUF87 domain-containing protein [Allokutzneria sp. A3M-2-11 16]MCP3800722.1 type IV secretion system DNA-binding domain-containing protein [Allokutzneria sp. A3M-2-11 16]
MRHQLWPPVVEFLHDPSGTLTQLLDALTGIATRWWPIVLPTTGIVGAVVLAVSLWWRQEWRRRLGARARVISILPPPTATVEGAITLWSNMLGLLRPKRLRWFQPHVAFEYVFTHSGIDIQLWVPGVIPAGMVERAIEAAWPGAHTRTRPATTLLPNGENVVAAGGRLRLAMAEALPLRTDHPADPLRALLAAPGVLGDHEAVCVQILARPAAALRVAAARRAARRLRATATPGRVLDAVTPGRHPARLVDRQTTMAATVQDRAVVTKLRGTAFTAHLRYALTTVPDPAETSVARSAVRGRAHAVAAAFAAFSDHNHLRRARLPQPQPWVNTRRWARGNLYSVPELAAVAHLPTDDTVLGLRRAGARPIPPPPGIATTGPGIKPLGISDAGAARPIGLRLADARHHVHILGPTGSGKSELLARLALDDATHGRGAVVIDPKGDLVTDILARLPEHLGPRVVLFDARSTTRPPVLNPLDAPDRLRAADNLVSIISRIYASSWGPRTEDVLRCGLLTLAAAPGTPKLSDLPTLLTNQAFRHRALAHVGDPMLRTFWADYNDLSDAARLHITGPLMNKLRGLLLRPFVRNAITAGPSTVDMNRVLDDGGLCLVRLAKDHLGADTARLVGSIIVAATWHATTARAAIPRHQRRDAGLYVDEAHNFLNLPIPLDDMLAEARAYALSVLLAHQNLDQLSRELAESISANARTKIILSASPEDARRLARHTHPQLTEHDLAHLDAFQAAVRLVSHGATTPAFTLRTEKLPPAIPGRIKAIRRAAAVNTGPHGAFAPAPNARGAA